MFNKFQESLVVDRKMRPAYAQMATGLALVIAMVACGLFGASHAKSEESKAAANVSAPLFISSQSLEPNLNGMLATGDGGATLPLEEIVGGVSRDAFDRKR